MGVFGQMASSSWICLTCLPQGDQGLKQFDRALLGLALKQQRNAIAHDCETLSRIDAHRPVSQIPGRHLGTFWWNSSPGYLVFHIAHALCIRTERLKLDPNPLWRNKLQMTTHILTRKILS
jgi:hypothetical protein